MSGIGRENGLEAIRQYTEVKSILVNLDERPNQWYEGARTPSDSTDVKGDAMAWAERYDYSPIAHRKPLRLPKGARVAVWTIVNVEEWDINHPMARRVPPPPGAEPTPHPMCQTLAGSNMGCESASGV